MRSEIMAAAILHVGAVPSEWNTKVGPIRKYVDSIISKKILDQQFNHANYYYVHSENYLTIDKLTNNSKYSKNLAS